MATFKRISNMNITTVLLCLAIIVSHEGLIGASSKAGFAFRGASFGRTSPSQQIPQQNFESKMRLPSALGSVLSTMESSLPTTSYSCNNPLESSSSVSLVSSVWSDQDEFLQLYHHLGAAPNGLLRLEATDDGMRGVCVNRDVKRGETLLMVPLASCLCDNIPPTWLSPEDDEFLISSSLSGGGYENPNNWATRLAASLLDLQLRSDSASTGQKLWLSLLPNNHLLRASLPVHWDSTTLQSAHCTALELAVDSAYFARAQAVSELIDGLRQSELVGKDRVQSVDLDQLCHDALDVVQTRACRLEPSSSDPHGQTLRVLAPIFDFINHGTRGSTSSTSSANACFGLHMEDNAVDVLRSGSVAVTATRDIGKNEEVLIDYGSSARPAWKCLSSYGFVPPYRRTQPVDDTLGSSQELADDEDDDEEEETEDDENLAEVYLDGVRYEVGPSTIPYEMVEATEAVIRAEKFPDAPLAVLRDTNQEESMDHAARLTPEIAIRIANRISDVAYKLLLQPEFLAEDIDEVDEEEEEEEELESSTPEQLVAAKLAASLRWSQHNILLACALGLQEWAIQS